MKAPVCVFFSTLRYFISSLRDSSAIRKEIYLRTFVLASVRSNEQSETIRESNSCDGV